MAGPAYWVGLGLVQGLDLMVNNSTMGLESNTANGLGGNAAIILVGSMTSFTHGASLAPSSALMGTQTSLSYSPHGGGWGWILHEELQILVNWALCLLVLVLLCLLLDQPCCLQCDYVLLLVLAWYHLVLSWLNLQEWWWAAWCTCLWRWWFKRSCPYLFEKHSITLIML